MTMFQITEGTPLPELSGPVKFVQDATPGPVSMDVLELVPRGTVGTLVERTRDCVTVEIDPKTASVLAGRYIDAPVKVRIEEDPYAFVQGVRPNPDLMARRDDFPGKDRVGLEGHRSTHLDLNNDELSRLLDGHTDNGWAALLNR